MTDLRQAAQQALEALLDDCLVKVGPHSWERRSDLAITALRAALAEPQTWVCPDAADTHRYDEPGHCEDCGKALIISTEIKGDKERAHGIGGDA